MKRRAFLTGIASAFAAPAIVKAENLMKIAVLRETVTDMPGFYADFGTDPAIAVWQWHEARIGYTVSRIDLTTSASITRRLMVSEVLREKLDPIVEQLLEIGRPQIINPTRRASLSP